LYDLESVRVKCLRRGFPAILIKRLAQCNFLLLNLAWFPVVHIMVKGGSQIPDV